MAHRLSFSGAESVSYEAFNPTPPGPGQVRVTAICSLMSTGTETIAYARRFAAGTHWDGWVKYPFYPGYALIGRVVELGEGVSELRENQRVAVRVGHASEAVVDADACFPVPDSVPSESAAWFALAKITSMGARAAQYQPGDSVLIVGAGPIGQMSTRWASALGAETVLVSDLATGRLEYAKRGGATGVIDGNIDDARDAVLELNHGQLPRVVIDSTGHAEVFASALGLVADRGRLVLLGDTGTPSGQHLTSDVIIRGLTVVGAHDGHEDAEWNAGRIYRYFFHLLQTGRFSVDGLITHRFGADRCQDAYSLAVKARHDTMGILFDWAGESGVPEPQATVEAGV